VVVVLLAVAVEASVPEVEVFKAVAEAVEVQILVPSISYILVAAF
jgi:hypothetical protein